VDSNGAWLEVPVYTEMVPFWRMLTAKRVELQARGRSTAVTRQQRWNRRRDFMRFLYPLKLDFCRMTLEEMTSMIRRVIDEDRRDPAAFRPLVAIGHTKDVVDLHAIDAFLCFLKANDIKVSTFEGIYPRLLEAVGPAMATSS
jgi:hypothetical protein